MTALEFASIALLLAFVIANWLLPRYLGVRGMLLGHFALLVTYFVFAMGASGYKYDGFLSVVGLAVQAFILNCLLLPIALIALWRRRRLAVT